MGVRGGVRAGKGYARTVIAVVKLQDWSWPLHHACMFIKCIEVSGKLATMLCGVMSLEYTWSV